MPKWIGGIFGNTIASTGVGTAVKGVFSSADQYYMKQEGGWIFSIEATGGTIIDSGGFRIHVFTSPGSFVVTNVGPGLVEYVVVAGGGGGGGSPTDGGGGGGAGGFRTATNFPVVASTYPITVGGGGASVTSGNPSIFDTITSTGGGRGGLAYSDYGASGGSGGGAGIQNPSGGSLIPASTGTGNTPPTSPPQGNPGGGSRHNPGVAGSGGGGGGSGAAGGDAPANNIGGNGGIGSPITWIPASYGTPGPAPGRYFAGGGGGFSSSGPGAGNQGGAGGGGSAINGSGSGTSGTTNTGGGGGSGRFASSGSGGSGIVIIRYPIA